MVVTRSKIMVNYYGAELTRLCIVPMYLCNTQILNNNIDTFTNDIYIYTILPKVLGHPLAMKGLTTLVISMSTDLNV